MSILYIFQTLYILHSFSLIQSLLIEVKISHLQCFRHTLFYKYFIFYHQPNAKLSGDIHHQSKMTLLLYVCECILASCSGDSVLHIALAEQHNTKITQHITIPLFHIPIYNGMPNFELFFFNKNFYSLFFNSYQSF